MTAKHGTSIEWTQIPGTKGETWNPIVAYNEDGDRGWHCAKVSEGCQNCYAERQNQAARYMGTGLPFKESSLDQITVRLHEETLLKPLRWRKPRTIFVCSMTDLYGEWMKEEWWDLIRAIQMLCPQHTFLELTKRPKVMAEVQANCGENGSDFITRMLQIDDAMPWAERLSLSKHTREWRQVLARFAGLVRMKDHFQKPIAWPPKNVWMGTTVENQKTADQRRAVFERCRAAVRFVSYEPAMENVNWEGWEFIDQLLIGGESFGRPFNVEWAFDAIDWCRGHGVAPFFKQVGTKPRGGVDEDGNPIGDWREHYGKALKSRKGSDLSELPSRLHVREWPDPKR